MSGWDEGQVYVQNMGLAPTTSRLEDSEAEERFARFIREFQIDNHFMYREQLRQSEEQLRNSGFLRIRLEHLYQFDENLADMLRTNPAKYMPLFENAASTVYSQIAVTGPSGERMQIQVQLKSDAQPLGIRRVS